MWTLTTAVLLGLASTSLAQTNNDVAALSGLQSCLQARRGSIAYLNGWGVGLSTASAGRRLTQTPEICAQAAAVSSAIPCAPPTGVAVPPTPPTPPGSAAATPPRAASPPGVNTTPSGIPTGTSDNPCGDTANPVPWTGLTCTGGRVTEVVISQLGPNIFAGTCDVGNLTGLANLSAAVTVDFTAAGLYGTVPAAWGTGAWAGTLKRLVLAQNPNITGAIPNLSGLNALEALELSNSSFSGRIPASFNSSGYRSLLSFTAFANNLSGPLPTSLPANLTTLGVGQNRLNGTLPTYNSTTLSTFQVQRNNLTGCLPSSWTTSLPNLTNVDLSYNQLSGPIPQTWQAKGSFPKLQTINIVGNQLCGSLGDLGTPVAPVGTNNPNATRLVPSPGTLSSCSGNSSCA